MRIAISFLLVASAWGQRIPGPGGMAPSGGGGIGTPTGASTGAAGTGTTITSGTFNTATGDTALAYFSAQSACTNFTSSSNLPLPTTASGSFTWHPVPTAGGGDVIGVVLDSGGTYATAPSCVISGGGGSGATCSVSFTFPSVTAISITLTGSGYTSIPSISFTGGTPTVNATAHVISMGQPSGAGSPTACGAAWYAASVAATTSNTVTVGSISALFRGVSVADVSGLATSPADTGASATGSSLTSITSNAFTTANASEIMLCGTRVEAVSQTWCSPSSNCPFGSVNASIVSGATPTGSNSFQTIGYAIFSGIQTGQTAKMASNGSQIRNLICQTFHQ